jgi:aminoglycoside phosphotransferase (APT) family kinase protein
MSNDSKATIDIDALVRREKLQPWLDDNIPELGSGPLSAKLISGGTSNVIIALNRGGEKTLVMRRPPADPPPGSKKAVEREATLLSALNATRVPHPHVYGKCFDPELIGSSFYIMELVDGWAPELNNRNCLFNPPFDREPLIGQLAYAMVDGLIALANVDYLAIGLKDFGKPDGFLERQVDRWGSQLAGYVDTYKNYQGREIPGLDRVADWLRNNIPTGSKAGLIHGDYGFPNVMFCHDEPPRLAAMIDWELATVGDPLLDIGWYFQGFRDEREPDVIPRTTYFDASKFPTRQELAAYYAKGTGRDTRHLDYYMVLAMYKGACILEYKVAAAMDGQMSKEMGEMFDKFVLDNAAEAVKLVEWNS